MGQVAVKMTEMTPEAVWARLRRDWLMVVVEDGPPASMPGEDVVNVLGRPQAISSGWRPVGDEWFALVAARREQLGQWAIAHNSAAASSLTVMIAEADPVDFLAGFWAALLSGWSIALANAKWSLQEWQSAYTLIQPQVLWASLPFPPASARAGTRGGASAAEGSSRHRPAIFIPTGGSAGQLKFTHHTWQTLLSSVTGFHQHFLSLSGSPASTRHPELSSTPHPTLHPTPHSTLHPTPINACCVLPLYHVSGLLQVFRTALTEGQLFLTSFKKALLTASADPAAEQSLFAKTSFLSLVPTQLSRLLDANKAAWLSQFHAVLLGGAPPWPSLLERAIAHQISLCLSYGMTETAAMVSATDPRAVLEGKSLLSSGHAMPHATINIERAGQILPAGEVGQVVVRSAAIACGYHNMPSPDFASNTFYTDDLGYLDADGKLHITGRASGKIISGGENIFPAEVESALRSTGQVRDVCVVGLPHPTWGEAVSAAYVPVAATVSPESLKAALVKGDRENMTPALSRYKVPKHWFPLPQLPRNEQGKINRPLLLTQLSARLKMLSSVSA